MKIKKETRRAGKKLFRSCFVDGQLDEARIRNTIGFVISNKPRHYLELLTMLEKLTRQESQKHSLFIHSSVSLNENEIKEIQTKVQTRFPAPLTATHHVNPALIGGLRIQVGSNVWDGSVAAKLKQLRIEN